MIEQLNDYQLEPPYTDDYIDCHVCGNKVDIDDSYFITDEVQMCEKCFDYIVSQDIGKLKPYLSDCDSELLDNIVDRLEYIQKKG